jgi:hypothetical protein
MGSFAGPTIGNRSNDSILKGTREKRIFISLGDRTETSRTNDASRELNNADWIRIHAPPECIGHLIGGQTAVETAMSAVFHAA